MTQTQLSQKSQVKGATVTEIDTDAFDYTAYNQSQNVSYEVVGGERVQGAEAENADADEIDHVRLFQWLSRPSIRSSLNNFSIRRIAGQSFQLSSRKRSWSPNRLTLSMNF